MGHPIRTLEELSRKGGGYVRLDCPCGRSTLYSVHDLAQWFRFLKREHPWDAFTRRCVCSACGRREPKATWLREYAQYAQAIRKKRPVRIPPPDEVPAGVDPVRWAHADEAGRKRLMREVRG